MARRRPASNRTVEPYLGDVIDMAAVPATFRRAPQRDNAGLRRAAFVVGGVLVFWLWLIWAVAR